MNIYILVFVLYLILIILGYINKNKIFIGLSGLAFILPMTSESNIIVILLSVILMFAHFLIAFYSDKENEDF